VPDLFDRIQSALGATYRIERELGGGMSRVFVAEDVGLGRRVVLKVLPPEMASGVNGQRFAREIRLAAQLQHPHIVPLLAAGSVDGLPYYVMPYIEGESLRTRLARGGELPLAEVVKILHEVLDAVDHAHQHGVVHRDIKPDNILLAGHHAVVTDFGVAKALDDATSDVRLTSTGIAVGTPAYMAPEQIAAEPNVDHRADIYAIGALAFEMVTGLPPFRGATTQAILAAHMSQPAPSIATLRQTIPPALDTIVLRCLEKRPADRWQTAGEIIPHLESVSSVVTTPSATARTAAPAIPAPEPVRQAHPLRWAVLFGLASVVVLALVWILVQSLGLPDWVFQGAIALLVAGVPIMLLTSSRERQRAAATDAPTPVGLARLFTWRRSIQGGVMAFAGLGVLTAAFMASRALGIGPGATLVSAGVLAPRDRIVIADFENRTADSTLALTVTQLLRIDLAQSPSISVMEPGQVSMVLARMQRDRATDVTPEVAQEIATREGIKAYLTGEILPAGSGFVITARLVSPSTGDALVTLRQNVALPDELMDGVDRLSSKLREEIGESLRSVRADPPLEQVTTASLPALQLYVEGTRAADRTGFDQAISLLQQAVQVDTNFAMAWRRLGIYATNPGQGPLVRAMGDSALRRAYALRNRLPERERLFVEASYATVVEPDFAAAEAAYSAILAKHPNDVTALNNLAAMYDRTGRNAEAIDLFRRTIATRVAPALTYANAIGAAGVGGRFAEADTVVAQLRQDFPESSELTEAVVFLSTYRQDFQTVDSVARQMLSRSPRERVVGHRALAMTAALRGRPSEASRERRSAMRVEQQRGQMSAADAELVAGLDDIRWNADFTTQPEPLIRRLDALWTLNRELTVSRPRITRRYPWFAMAYARLGAPEKAEEILNEHLQMMTDRDYPGVGARMNDYLASATIAVMKGRPDEALSFLREGCGVVGSGYTICENVAFLEAAEAHDKAGRADSAIVAYRRFVEFRGMRQFGPPGMYDAVTPRIAPAWRRLGELLEAKGDKQQAIDAYEAFLEHWRHAEPELQPIVRDVRDRVNRLRRATG
jgi:tetratricopeptide (TPR) repeat protein/tRNA A-37 threonylcarbamoyl transferase component Bud32